jgi:ribonuclease P protein component
MMPRSPRRGRQRLSRSAEFERVYRHGKSVANRYVVLYTFPNALVERPRLGLSVSRRVGGAVERNRVKRLLREAFEHVAHELEGEQDVVVVARPQLLELAEREGLRGVAAALEELLAKSGLRRSDPRRSDPRRSNAAVEVEAAVEGEAGGDARGESSDARAA